MKISARRITVAVAAVLAMLGLTATPAAAKIDGVSGTDFELTARSGHLQASDGASLLFWGYALDDGLPQYPGPTLIVDQDERITISLSNELTAPVSIVFPGHAGVVAAGDQEGELTAEAPPGGSAVYSFIASEPGTYLYHSGTRPELQVEMGLLGVIIVRPVGFDPNDPLAYNHPDTAYDYEYLFLLTEMDHRVHEAVEFGGDVEAALANWFPYYWFLNGRNAPDTMSPAFAEDLPYQPYNCVPRTRPGEHLLMRIVGGGRDMHPFHHHGNNSTLIAKDGRLVARDPSTGPDLATSYFTIPSFPGSTYDAIWDPWTGKGLGWDIYPGSLEPWEDPTYDGVPVPVELPDENDLTFGGFFSGSPFLGSMGTLPVGEGGFNVNGGLAFMWHSHNEKELTTNDIFPGGMFTMMMVEPPDVVIED